MSDTITPTPPVKTMTPAEQRVAIAIACGWTDCDINTYQRPPLLLGDKPTFQGGKVVSYLVDQRIPDYLNDLNAMHEAEKRFIGDASSAMTYAMNILRVRGQDINNENDDLNCDHAWISANATAAEKAMAFLKTLDLYTA